MRSPWALSHRADLGGEAYGLADAEAAFGGVIAVVNATSTGLADDSTQSFPLSQTPDGCVVMDMVYNPHETKLLKLARSQKKTINSAVPSDWPTAFW